MGAAVSVGVREASLAHLLASRFCMSALVPAVQSKCREAFVDSQGLRNNGVNVRRASEAVSVAIVFRGQLRRFPDRLGRRRGGIGVVEIIALDWKLLVPV